MAVKVMNALGPQFNVKRSKVIGNHQYNTVTLSTKCNQSEHWLANWEDISTSAKKEGTLSGGVIGQGLQHLLTSLLVLKFKGCWLILTQLISTYNAYFYAWFGTELSKSWWKKIEAVWNETARSVLQVHRRTVVGAYCELERQAVIHHAERQDGHFELLEEVSQAREEEGEKNEGEAGDKMTVVEKKAKRMRALTRVAKMEYAAEGERGTRAWLWHNFLTNGRCLVGQQRSLVITNPRKERLMNAIRCGGLPIGKKWGAIQQSEEDSKCPACDAEEETAEHFLLRCPNLWEDRFRIWSVDNGSEEQVRKLIIEDCTTKLLSSGKKCNRAQEMEQCKQSCKRVWRLWAARASWKHGSSSAFYQSLEVM
ncbi:RNase H type-1 domain-containing protein [Balamuthia mandrillaris]